MRVAQLTLEQGLFRLDRLTRALSWLLPLPVALFCLSMLAATVHLPRTFSFSCSVVAFALIVVCWTMTAMWFHRANANLHLAGHAMQHGPQMAWVWFLVPIANLFKPYMVLREICEVSHGQHSASASPATSRLALWWGCWIAGIVLFRLSMDLARSGVALPIVGTLFILSLIGFLVSALCLRLLMRSVNTAQQGQGDSAVFA